MLEHIRQTGYISLVDCIERLSCAIFNKSGAVRRVINDPLVSTGSNFAECHRRYISVPQMVVKDASAVGSCVVLEFKDKVKSLVQRAKTLIALPRILEHVFPRCHN